MMNNLKCAGSPCVVSHFCMTQQKLSNISTLQRSKLKDRQTGRPLFYCIQ